MAEVAHTLKSVVVFRCGNESCAETDLRHDYMIVMCMNTWKWTWVAHIDLPHNACHFIQQQSNAQQSKAKQAM